MKKSKSLLSFLIVGGMVIALALLFNAQLVETVIAANTSNAPEYNSNDAGSLGSALLARNTPTKTPRNSSLKKTPTPKKTAKPTNYPTARPVTATFTPTETVPEVQPTTVITTTDTPVPPAPALNFPDTVGLQVCLQGACKDYPVEVYCTEEGTCDGSATIPAADCGSANDCEATVNLTCQTAENGASPCSGSVNLTPCGGLPSCDPALEFTCSETDCSPSIPVYMPAGGPTRTPAPVSKPGLFSQFSGFPWIIFLICFVVILIGLGIGVFVLWRMSGKGEEDEEEENPDVTQPIEPPL